jgi:manganese transport protein
VVLSLQLSFAVIPLIHLVSDRRWMGPYQIRPWLQGLSWLAAALIAGLNLSLVYSELSSWFAASAHPWVLWTTVVPIVLATLVLLGYVTVVPIFARLTKAPIPALVGVHGPSEIPVLKVPPPVRRIAVALDFTCADSAALSHAIGLAREQRSSPSLILFHVVESGGARLIGAETEDAESRSDRARLTLLASELGEQGIEADCDLGFGRPVDALAELVERNQADLLIMGGHGHRGVEDMVHGTTVNGVRHKLKIPVLVIPEWKGECLES